MIFENSSPKGIFGPNMSDSPNWSLTANSRSLQAAALKWIVGGELAGGEVTIIHGMCSAPQKYGHPQNTMSVFIAKHYAVKC